MNIRRIAISAVLVALVWTPGFVLAQGGGSSHWLLHDPRGRGPAWGTAIQMQGIMEQMSGMMEHMAARIQAGPLTPEQTKQMGEVMAHMADMINTSFGMHGEETPQQVWNMMQRMTEMHKRMMSLIATPPQDKK